MMYFTRIIVKKTLICLFYPLCIVAFDDSPDIKAQKYNDMINEDFMTQDISQTKKLKWLCKKILFIFRNDLDMALKLPYFQKGMKYLGFFTCFGIKNSTFDLVLAWFCFLVFAIIAYLAGIDMMELFILFQTHSINPITAFQYRFQAENSSFNRCSPF